jgi:hypothetical protein
MGEASFDAIRTCSGFAAARPAPTTRREMGVSFISIFTLLSRVVQRREEE